MGLDGRWKEWRVSMECGRILILPADDPLHFSTLAFSAFVDENTCIVNLCVC